MNAPPGPFPSDVTLETMRVHNLTLESVRKRLKKEAHASDWATALFDD